MDEASTGNGITLRRWQPSDSGALSEVAARSAKHLSAFLPSAIGELHEPELFIDRAQDAWDGGRMYALAVFDDEGRLAGQVTLTPDGMTGEIGYWIAADRVGRGLATAAANVASARVAAKAGFHHVGSRAVSGRGTDAQSGVEMLWVLDD